MQFLRDILFIKNTVAKCCILNQIKIKTPLILIKAVIKTTQGYIWRLLCNDCITLRNHNAHFTLGLSCFTNNPWQVYFYTRNTSCTLQFWDITFRLILLSTILLLYSYLTKTFNLCCQYQSLCCSSYSAIHKIIEIISLKSTAK